MLKYRHAAHIWFGNRRISPWCGKSNLIIWVFTILQRWSLISWHIWVEWGQWVTKKLCLTCVVILQIYLHFAKILPCKSLPFNQILRNLFLWKSDTQLRLFLQIWSLIVRHICSWMGSMSRKIWAPWWRPWSVVVWCYCYTEPPWVRSHVFCCPFEHHKRWLYVFVTRSLSSKRFFNFNAFSSAINMGPTHLTFTYR